MNISDFCYDISTNIEIIFNLNIEPLVVFVKYLLKDVSRLYPNNKEKEHLVGYE